MRPRPSCALLFLALFLGGAGGPALASTDPDDPPPLAPVRDPAPQEPPASRLVLAVACSGAELNG